MRDNTYLAACIGLSLGVVIGFNSPVVINDPLQNCADRWPSGTSVLNERWLDRDEVPGWVEGIDSVRRGECRVDVRWHMPNGLQVRTTTPERDLRVQSNAPGS